SKLESKLESKLDSKLNSLRDEMNNGFQKVHERIDNLEKQITHVIFKEHAPVLDDHERRIKKLEIAAA
ncbi:MAG: hypothetical protein HY547_07280, partial [Elusimicrobia bacterium]|nr:hypothetical protein [Elusimicrobiota bacterium]